MYVCMYVCMYVLGGWKSHGKVTVNSENEH
jgi:hypothetical protein